MSTRKSLATHLAVAAVIAIVACAEAQDDVCKRVRTFAVDPVELLAGRELKGEAAHFAVRGMYNYQFVSAANKAAFEKQPEKFEVQLGGACARMGPLSGYGRGDIYAVHGGRIYLFASKQCRESFLSAPEKLLQTDDAPPERDATAEKHGRELIELAVKHAGGARVDEIKTYRHATTRSEVQGGKEYVNVNTIMFAFPDRVRREESWNDWVGGQVLVGDGGFGVDSKATEDMPLARDQVRAVRRIANRQPVTILRARTRPDFLALARGSRTVDGGDGQCVIVYFDGCKSTLTIEPKTGKLLALETRMRSPNMSLADARIVYTEEKTAEGITLPSAWRIEFDGVKPDESAQKLSLLEINPDLPQKLFEQPKK